MGMSVFLCSAMDLPVARFGAALLSSSAAIVVRRSDFELSARDMVKRVRRDAHVQISLTMEYARLKMLAAEETAAPSIMQAFVSARLPASISTSASVAHGL